MGVSWTGRRSFIVASALEKRKRLRCRLPKGLPLALSICSSLEREWCRRVIHEVQIGSGFDWSWCRESQTIHLADLEHKGPTAM